MIYDDDKTDEIELDDGFFNSFDAEENQKVEEKSEYDKLKEFFFGKPKDNGCECGAKFTGGKHSKWCKLNNIISEN